MELLTVFTPTYNRRQLLTRLYSSLIIQSFKNFIWLIIDDGSNDDTSYYVKQWQTEDKIKIKYVYQENKGMLGAHNKAYSIINTELCVCIDSDDFMPKDAIKLISEFWENNRSEDVAGIIALNENTDGHIIGSHLPENLKISNVYDLYKKYKCSGDKKLIYRTDIINRFRYPSINGERYIPTSYIYNQIDMIRPMLLLNKVVCTVDYQINGMSKNKRLTKINNPNNFMLYHYQQMLMAHSLKDRFKNAAQYVLSSWYAGEKTYLESSEHKLFFLLSTPLAFFTYLILYRKIKKLKN